jgi:hypothetical protein
MNASGAPYRQQLNNDFNKKIRTGKEWEPYRLETHLEAKAKV